MSGLLLQLAMVLSALGFSLDDGARLLQPVAFFAAAQDAKPIAGHIRITGAEKPTVPPQPEPGRGTDDVQSVTVAVGDPVEIDASDVDAKLFFWHSCDHLDAHCRWYSRDGRTDSILAFWPPRAGRFTFLLVMTSDDVPTSREFVVTVEDGATQNPNPDPEPDPPTDLGLAAKVTAGVESTVTGDTRRLEALAHAELFRAVAKRMKTASNPRGDIKTVGDVQDTQRNVNVEYRESLNDARQKQWTAFFLEGGPLASALNKLGAAGKLDTVDDVHAAWLEIVEGLEAVK